MRILQVAIAFTIIGFFFQPWSAEAQTATEISCRDIQIPEDMDPNTGAIIWQTIPGEMIVEKDARGKHGYVGTVNLGNHMGEILDTDFQVVTRNELEDAEAIAVVEMYLPQVDTGLVQSGRVANIGVAANLDDAAGYLIIELLDAQKQPLAKITRIGWGYGICGS